MLFRVKMMMRMEKTLMSEWIIRSSPWYNTIIRYKGVSVNPFIWELPEKSGLRHWASGATGLLTILRLGLTPGPCCDGGCTDWTRNDVVTSHNEEVKVEVEWRSDLHEPNIRPKGVRVNPLLHYFIKGISSWIWSEISIWCRWSQEYLLSSCQWWSC